MESQARPSFCLGSTSADAQKSAPRQPRQDGKDWLNPIETLEQKKKYGVESERERDRQTCERYGLFCGMW